MSKKVTCSLFILATILTFIASANTIDLRISGDKLSVHANKEPLQNILRRLSDVGDIKVRIDPHINPKITISFEDRGIRQALDSILKPFGHVLIWETVEGSDGPISKLAEIQVFKPGKRDLMKPLGEKADKTVLEKPRQPQPEKMRRSSPIL